MVVLRVDLNGSNKFHGLAWPGEGAIAMKD